MLSITCSSSFRLICRTSIRFSQPFKPLSFLRFHFPSRPVQNPNPQNPNLRMSSTRSCFDVLMASSRAAGQKKKSRDADASSSAASPKKVKTLEEENSADQIPNPKDEPSPKMEARVDKAEDDPSLKKAKMEVQSPKPSPKKGGVKEAQSSNSKGNPSPKKGNVEVLSSKPKEEPSKVKTGVWSKEVKSVNLDEKIGNLKKKGSEFKPELAAFWEAGERVPFVFLARAFDLIEKESGRNMIAEILSNVFRTVIATTPEDLIPIVYLSANKIAPAHDGIELGIGDAAIIKALANAYGRSEKNIKDQLKEHGDLGIVAKESRSSQRVFSKPLPLTVAFVLNKFREIAKQSGKDSQEKKRNLIQKLLVAATDCEPQFIIRLLQSKMRIGLQEKTLFVALGQAAVYSEKPSTSPSQLQSSLEEASKIVKKVFSVLPDYDKVVSALLKSGVWKLPEICKFTPGVPVGPMLAKATKGVSEILNKFQGIEFTCEYKYDGERAQIHYLDDGSVEIYSRNAERNTGKFPDVVNSVERFKKSSVSSFVLDCEVVAYDREKNRILPFQILSTRARKGVEISDIKVQVCIFAFDILYLNGHSLLQEQLNVRREHLYNSFEEVPGEFHFAKAISSNDLEEIQKFLESAVNDSCEGLIVKTLYNDATYEPANRSQNWLKLKKDYMESVGDSLDLVPIGAFHGRGKRTGVYGAFLLACYDDKDDEYQTICKIGTGFSEVVLEERSTSLRSNVITVPKQYYRYSDTQKPDVWFEPTEVWEVKAADLSISPVHCAATGLVDSNKGISLRFPRLLRVREDKRPEEATSSEQVAEMYRAQKFNHANNQAENDSD